MNPTVKAKWIDALSTYEQGFNKLYDGECFCVLGVLVDLYLKEKGEEWKCGGRFFGGYYVDDNSDPEIIINREIMGWAGLISPDPFVEIDGKREKMTYLNDVLQVSFDEFKELINNQL